LRNLLSSARRRPRTVLVSVVALALASGLAAVGGVTSTTPAASASTSASTCQPFGVMPVAGGTYNVQADEWNSGATQCVSTDGNADFTVTQSAINTSTSGPPGSYPSIYRGCHWGTCTTSSGLPIPVSSLGDPTTSWSTTQTGTGAYDVAYDIWFNQTPSTSGQPNGTEVMIWLNHNGAVQPAGSPVATVTLGGYTYDVWYAQMSSWKYVAYVIRGGTSSVSNLDLGTIARDATARGYLSSAWYLIDVEAGFELWQGGAGLATNSFAFDPTGTGTTTSTTTTTTSSSTTTTAPTTSTTTTTTTPATSGVCSATYQVTAQWVNGTPPNGFTANVTVRNTESSTIGHWTVGWTWPAPGQAVTSAWNAAVTQAGPAVAAKNLSYNGTIAPGATQSFGFQGIWTGSNPMPTLTCST
jgi:hypothetical protein